MNDQNSSVSDFLQSHSLDSDTLTTSEESTLISTYRQIKAESRVSVFESEAYQAKRSDVIQQLTSELNRVPTSQEIGKVMINWYDQLIDSIRAIKILIKRRKLVIDKLNKGELVSYNDTITREDLGYLTERKVQVETRISEELLKHNHPTSFEETEDDLPF